MLHKLPMKQEARNKMWAESGHWIDFICIDKKWAEKGNSHEGATLPVSSVNLVISIQILISVLCSVYTNDSFGIDTSWLFPISWSRPNFGIQIHIFSRNLSKPLYCSVLKISTRINIKKNIFVFFTIIRFAYMMQEITRTKTGCLQEIWKWIQLLFNYLIKQKFKHLKFFN